MRWALVLYGVLSAAATFGLPPATRFGFWRWSPAASSTSVLFFVLLLTRRLQGWALACVYPAMGGVTSEWATWEQSGMFTALLSTSLQLGAVLTMPLAGVVCESRWRWPLLYVLQGAATLLATAAFFWAFRGPAIWGIFAGFFGVSFAFQLFNQHTPVYLRRVLELRVESAGWAAALPPLSDHLPLLSACCRLVLFASVAPSPRPSASWRSPSCPPRGRSRHRRPSRRPGLNAVGVMKATQLVAGPFAAVLMAVNQLLASFGLLVLPPIVAAVAPHNTREEVSSRRGGVSSRCFQWALLLVGTALFVLATTAFFDLTATATPRPWATGNNEKRTVFRISGREESCADRPAFALD
ncbi:Major facilitator superfamily MFS-1 domain containing protein [Aphelenchoides fujianensis]|nr:Major facilitator superfamily MFS-1 domain containing protein [Aphelenchoides fujianensis]